MATLPKMRYEGKPVTTLRVNGAEQYYCNINGVCCYHKHFGSSSSGTGCYTYPKYHVHTDSCYETGRYGRCDMCNTDYGAWAIGQTCTTPGCGNIIGEHEYSNLVCGNTESTIEYYNLGCGYDAT